MIGSSRPGRPLRFVALVVAGWAGARVAILWPTGATVPEAIEAAFPLRTAAADRKPADIVAPIALTFPLRPTGARTIVRGNPGNVQRRGDQARIDFAVLGLIHFGPEQAFGVPTGMIVPRRTPESRDRREESDGSTSRWSAGAWFVTRRGAPAAGPMLGGDQAGIRIAYTPWHDRPVQLVARATAPLAQAGRELALGIEWQPTTLPVRLVAEQRIGLDGQRGGPAIGVVGGIGDVALPLDFRLEAYGQAGAVARAEVEPFADGMVRVTRQVARIGPARLELGGGAWGAAQRDAARLDVGPSAVAAVPVAGRAMRIALDWRERVAGDARPGSGPAVTIGTDF